MPKRAAFIVVEGLDRSGKSTQASILHDSLQSLGTPVRLIKFPDRTTAIGKMINSYLQSQSELDDRAIHLLFSANRWELASSIEALLLGGTTVLCDRYAFSGIAFSASKGLPFEWCRAPEISLPAPDLTLFLDIQPEKARERGGYGQERYETENIQRRVSEVFKRIGGEMSGELESGSASGRWVTVDAGHEQDTVARAIWKHVEPFVAGVDLPIPRLWESVES